MVTINEWSDKKKGRTAVKEEPEIKFPDIAAQMGLAPSAQRIVEKGSAGVGSSVSAAEKKSADTPYQKPFTAQGEAARLGSAPTLPVRRGQGYGGPFVGVGDAARLGAEPTHAAGAACTFSFSGNRDFSTSLDRMNKYGGGDLPGQQARIGMAPIAADVNGSPENLLAATQLGAYTNNWNIDDEENAFWQKALLDYIDYRQAQSAVQQPESGEKDYLERSFNQLALGNFSDDVTLLGTAAQLGLSMTGFDLPMDIRDLTYDLTNWEWTPEHLYQTAMDAVGILPLVGSLKYMDEAADLLGSMDEVGDLLDSAPDIADLLKKAPELGDLARDMNKLDDVLGSANEVIKGLGDSLNKLPKTTADSVSAKLDTYLLKPTHPVGGSKAKWFKEALGFTKDNSSDLAIQIAFDPEKAILTAQNAYGTKFSQVISVQGANGKIIDVEFIFIKNNDGVTRLVTSIPAKQ